jgi:predicted RNA-binding Zn-ribbon protein involved in translation (DUF1610 family)
MSLSFQQNRGEQMTSSITCPACNYTRKPTDDAPDWECPNCQKAYIKTARVVQYQDTDLQSGNQNLSNQTASATTMLISAASAVFTLGMMTYASKPWRMASTQFVGWIGFMLGFGLWAISPYVMLGLKSRKRNYTARQSITFLVGIILLAAFGVYGILDTMFIHPDAQGALIFVFLPGWQWIGVVVTIGIAEGRWAKHPI